MTAASIALPDRPVHASAPVQRRRRVYLPRRPETPAFQRFGEWFDTVRVARDGSIHRLARWVSLQPDTRRMLATGAHETLWDTCQAAHPSCFKEYRVVRLDRPSYFLPAGEVAFSVLVNPVQVPDNPPAGVMMRHLEAMDAFPSATFYFLRPVFNADDAFQLLSPDQLRSEAAGDRRVALQIARRFGWVHLAERWTTRLATRAGRAAMHTVGRCIDGLIALLSTADNDAWLDPLSVSTRQLSLASLAAEAEAEGRADDAARFRASLADLRRWQSIDPVLCFELPERPGELWFESHWYDGADGRRYVHF